MSTRPFRDGTGQATTLEEVAEFCRKRYKEVENTPRRFPSDHHSFVGQMSAYAAVYRIITGRHPDTPEEA